MNEAILHYIWQFGLYTAAELKTTDGRLVEIIDRGKHNSDAGPDFFNAKIKIDETLWAGNVEIHLLSSDWNRHGHNDDKAYDNVILHVVQRADTEVTRSNGDAIPQMELPVPQYILDNYEQLFAGKKWIACEDRINEMPGILMSSWKEALLVERLERKSNDIETLLEQSNNHWEEAFYITLARSFGFGTNSQAFEQLARSLPLKILGKHKDNLFQIEALLYGQAGFLSESPKDEYQASLSKEYDFLAHKYELKAMEVSQWKLLRLRPDNFPHIRIAQFASLIHKSSKLFSQIIGTENSDAMQKLFSTAVSEYWQTHYLFGSSSRTSKKQLGKASINSLLINTVAPFLFTYGKKNGSETDRAIQLLESLPAENNSIIKRWRELGQRADNAFDTQALLQLKKNYCDDKKCLRCRVGHKVLSSKV